MSKLKTLLANDIEVQMSDGRVITVSPLKFTQLPAGAEHINSVLASAINSGAVSEKGDLDITKIGELFAASGEPLFQLICLCSDIDRNELDAVEIEDGIDLAAALIEVNWRESIIKKLMAVSEKMTKNLSLIGPESVTDLSQQVTHSKTSKRTASARSSCSLSQQSCVMLMMF